MTFHFSLLSILCMYIPFSLLNGQNDWYTARVSHADQSIQIPLTEANPLVAYTFTWTGKLDQLEIRFSKDQTNWSAWQLLSQDPHVLHLNRTSLEFINHRFQYFQIGVHGKLPNDLTGHFHSPIPTTHTLQPGNKIIGLRSDECQCMQPAFLGRDSWCPANNCPQGSTPASTDITHLVVHHSAGTNNADDWAAIVRAIWSDHVNINRWDDIGYNWLIDPNGIIYEGRGYRTRGAHFCGKNTNTSGICLLGNFQNQAPTTAAIESLQTFLTWQSCDASIAPLLESELANTNEILAHIAGHRDGCSTQCPGTQLYPMLGDIRVIVNNQIESNCGVTTNQEVESPDHWINIFPNPSSNGIFRIQSPPNILRLHVQKIYLYSSIGQLQPFEQYMENTGNGILDFSHLPDGIYFLRINQLNQKIVIQRN